MAENIKNEKENDWANDVKGQGKHISEVESGLKGYYCRGCENPMQAVKRKDGSRSYFRHDPKHVKHIGKCTFSDETYRHIRAKEILQRIMEVKVPVLYKYSPDKSKRIKLSDAKIIKAHKVENELYFYENEAGEVVFGRNKDWETDSKLRVLIQPDVTFFDAKGIPILFIELVATHKIDEEKLIKLKRLKIDTIQVSLPRESPIEIENTFYKTQRTEWFYNYEQETTNYIPVPDRNSESVPPIDEFQRKLLKIEESYSCRATELKNIIRGLKECLESEQFRNTQRGFEQEILRVENNTERNRERLREIQSEHKDRIREEFSEKMANIGLGESEFREHKGDVEKKYDGFKPTSQAEIDRVEEEIRKFGTNSQSVEERRRELIGKIESTETQIRRVEAEIGRVIERRNSLPTKFGQIQIEFERGIRSKQEELEREFRGKEEKLGSEYEEYGKQSIEAIAIRNGRGTSRVSKRIQELFNAWGDVQVATDEANAYKRLRKVKECIENKTYKDWL